MSHKPAVLFSYANDLKRPARFLKALEKERDAIGKIWLRYQKKHDIIPNQLDNSHPVKLISHISLLKEALIIFHFSGHADGTLLELESEGEEGTELAGQNLATILKGKEKLRLVFLNACKTLDHVKRLHEAGIPAVLATSVSISDEEAAKFSAVFYEALTEGASLGEAFDAARISIESGEVNERIYTRDAVRKMTFVEGKIQVLKDWGLYVQDEDILNWKLADDVPQRPEFPHELNFAPPVPSHFIGREKEIEKLNQLLNDSQQVVLVNGLGGVGKTTLAQAYYHKFKADFDHIAWTYVPHDPEQQGENVSTAKDTIASEVELFKRLNLPFDPKNTTALERIQVLFGKLQSLEGNNLFIIDNATEAIAEIRPFLPKPPQWKILVTSRQQLQPFTRLDLSSLDPTEAKALFYAHYIKADKQEEIVENLLEHIGYHTLTIELLAKLCQNSLRLKPQHVYETLQAQNFKTLKQKVWTAHTENEVKVYSYLVGAFSISDLSDEEKYLLTQFAVLPAKGISFELLCELLQLEEAEMEDTEEVLLSLIKKGWISRDKDDNFSCHQIVQEVLRYQLEPDAQSCERLIGGLNSLLLLDQSKDNPVDKFPFIEYGDMFLEFVDEDNVEINDLKNNLALRHRDFGNYTKAVELLESAYESDLRHFEEDHPNIIRNGSNLALVYQDLGKNDHAVDLLESALISASSLFDEDDPNVAKIKSSLGVLYRDLGEYELAMDLLSSALDTHLNHFEDDDPDVATSRSNLAYVYKALGEYELAKELLESALESYLANYEEEHPFIATTKSNLAGLYIDLGEYERAVELMESALASNTTVFGDEHPIIVKRKSNLANFYQDMGEYGRAVELLESALVSASIHFGEDHPDVSTIKSNLSGLHQELGNYARAEELQKSSLLTDIARLGENHPNVARGRYYLGLLMMDMNNYQAAKDYFEKAYNALRIVLGEEHTNTKMLKNSLDTAIQKLSERS